MHRILLANQLQPGYDMDHKEIRGFTPYILYNAYESSHVKKSSHCKLDSVACHDSEIMSSIYSASAIILLSTGLYFTSAAFANVPGG